MKMLRKLTGSKMQFRYTAEYVELLPGRETSVYERDLPVSKTNARRTTGFAFEYFDPKFDKWVVISDSQYYKILNNHKTIKTIRRKKEGGVSESRSLHDIFHLTEHFVERMHERFVNNEDAIPGVLEYMIENGHYLSDDNPIIRHKLEYDQKNNQRFFVYEHDFRMLWVCELDTKRKKLKLITTFDPKTKWFNDYMRKYDFKNEVTMKQFVRSMV